MKMTKKKVFVAALAVCVVAILSLGTLAWFNASDSVNNNFYVADSTLNDEDDIFSINVYEKTPDSDNEEVGYTYENILPGATLKKEPIVKNTGYYSQYVRVIITISDAQVWLNALGANFNVTDVFDGFDATAWDMNNTWNSVAEATANGTLDQLQEITYVLYYNSVLAKDQEFTVFENVVIPSGLEKDDAAAFDGGFTIDVKAEAVQSEHTGSSAYEAFGTVGIR